MVIIDPEPLNVDEWTHVALTADGGQLRLYKNGKLAGVTDYHYLDSIGVSTQDWITIGASIDLVTEDDDSYFSINEATPQMFSGMIDDLAIWHVARSADDIQAIYEKGLTGENVSKVAVTIPDFVEPVVIIDQEPALSIVNNGDGTVTVTFEGKLQGAPTVNGPWADVEGAVSPQIVPATDAMQYGRAVSE